MRPLRRGQMLQWLLVLDARVFCNILIIDELSTEINENKIDIAVVVESWLQKDMPDASFTIPGYQTIRRVEKKSEGEEYACTSETQFHTNTG